jgi:hypothetical protein
MLRGWLAAACVAALIALSVPATANHPQAAHGDVLVFDHKTGNEWWVEVVLSGGASGSVSGVQVMDTGGPWVPLTKREWGAWAASFHIEPGHQVRFRATWSGGDTVDSCWFDHPSGVERCGSTTTTTTHGDPCEAFGTCPAFDAPFTGFRGNEWWVQANVGTSGPAIAKVDVRIAPDGAWKPLAKQSWGATAWAASYHFPQGSVLQMRATATTGQTDLSSCRQWIPPSGQDAAIVACPGTTPPPPPQFDATWSNVKGNEWWVEATVRANAPVRMVLLMIDCQTQTDPYDMGYRADWGKWVLGGIHIPAGSVVTMTAVGPNGAIDESATYAWPQATVAKDCPDFWPQDGSHADVRFRRELREFDGQGGERYTMWDGLVHTEYHGGRWIDETTWDGNAFWEGTCEQLVTRMDWDGTWSNTTETYAWDMEPPMGLVPAETGAVGPVETIGVGCQLLTTEATVLGRERRTFSMKDSSGDPIEVDAYRAGNSDTGFFEDYWYDSRLGLVLSWHTHSSGPHHTGSSRGWLLDTDAGFY